MNIPDYLVDGIVHYSDLRRLNDLSDEEIVIKALELQFGVYDDFEDHLPNERDLHHDICDFVLGNDQVLEKRTFLCVNIKDLRSFNECKGLTAGIQLLGTVANHISKEYPNSSMYYFRSHKFVVDLRDPFNGLEQGFGRELHCAFVKVSLQMKEGKYWEITKDGIFLTIRQALLETCKEGRTLTYESIEGCPPLFWSRPTPD